MRLSLRYSASAPDKRANRTSTAGRYSTKWRRPASRLTKPVRLLPDCPSLGRNSWWPGRVILFSTKMASRLSLPGPRGTSGTRYGCGEKNDCLFDTNNLTRV